MRLLVSLSVAVLVVAVPSAATAGECWWPPVVAPVADPFREPACRWCPGNRGIEYATGSGDAVRAVATGTVTFSGTVAGQSFLVVRHADGRRVTYGNLARPTQRPGDVVIAGAIVGRAAGAFHLGLRDGDRYLDPAPYIGAVRGVVRLVPTDGSPPPPAPAPRLTCRARASVGFR